jgi:hypothetical protein
MATYQTGKYWWYRFRFAGERIDEPTKSTSRTVAKEAERQHRLRWLNNFDEVRQNRVRILQEIIDGYLTGYRLRYSSASFAGYALRHVSRLLGTKIVADIIEISVLRYQEDRLREKAAPKSNGLSVLPIQRNLENQGLRVVENHGDVSVTIMPGTAPRTYRASSTCGSHREVFNDADCHVAPRRQLGIRLAETIPHLRFRTFLKFPKTYSQECGVKSCSRTLHVVDCPGVSVTMPVSMPFHSLAKGSPKLYCSSRATNGLSLGA